MGDRFGGVGFVGRSGRHTIREKPAEGIRSWFLIKFGHDTISIRDSDTLVHFLRELYKLIQENGMELKGRPSIQNLISDEAIEVYDTVEREACDVMRRPPVKLPIMFFIEDCDQGEIFSQLQEKFQQQMYMFRLTGVEIEDMIRRDDLQQLREWCEEFAKMVHEGDLLYTRTGPSQVGYIADSYQMRRMEEEQREIQERADRERRWREEEEESRRRIEEEEERRRRIEDEYNRANRRNNLYEDRTRTNVPLTSGPPPGVPIPRRSVFAAAPVPSVSIGPPPGMERRESREEELELVSSASDSDEALELVSSDDEQQQPGGSSDRSVYYTPPPGLSKVRCSEEQSSSNSPNVSRCPEENREPSSCANGDQFPSTSDSRHTNIGETPIMSREESVPLEQSGIIEEEDVDVALDELGAVDVRESTLIQDIFGDFFKRRLLHPFPSLHSNIRLLRMSNLSSKTQVPEAVIVADSLLDELLSTGFVQYVISELNRVVSIGPVTNFDPKDIGDAIMEVLRTIELFARKGMYTSEATLCWNLLNDMICDLPRDISQFTNKIEMDYLLHVVKNGRSPSPPPLPDVSLPTHLPLNNSVASSFTEANFGESINVPTSARSQFLDDAQNDGWGGTVDEASWARRTTGVKMYELPTQPNLHRDPLPMQESLWKKSEETSPPSDFRTLDVTPVVKDLYNPEPPYLRRALKQGSYQDIDHYLDVVFRLFREDLVSPLRDGISLWKRNGCTTRRAVSDNLGSDLFICDDVTVRGVQVRKSDGRTMRMVQIPAGVCLTIGDTRKLVFGSIICLSSDLFTNEFILGVVCEYDVEMLKAQNLVGVSFLDEDLKREDPLIDTTKAYILAEPPSFLEMYKHVLDSIKNMNPFLPMPMERYVVKGKRNIRKPVYMRIEARTEAEIEEEVKTQDFYDDKARAAQAAILMSDRKKGRVTIDKEGIIMKNENSLWKEKIARRERKRVDDEDSDYSDDDEMTSLTRKHLKEHKRGLKRPIHPNTEVVNWVKIRGKMYHVDRLMSDFQPDGITMDDSQRESLCRSLTQELSVIQGPPGTGKTFIGLEVVMALLENRERWLVNEPILIVCYTNQALDQFLERVHMKIAESIQFGNMPSTEGPLVVRLGLRSESEYLKKNNVLKADAMDTFRECALGGDPKNGKGVYHFIAEKGKAEDALCQAISVLRLATKKNPRPLNAHLLHTTHVIDPRHLGQLESRYFLETDSVGHPLSPDELLTCWLLDRTFTKEVGGKKEGDSGGRKRMDDDSDKEEEIVVESDSDSDEGGELLQEVLMRLNLEALQYNKQCSALRSDGDDTYEVVDQWLLVNMAKFDSERHVVLFGSKDKSGERMGKGFIRSRIGVDRAIMNSFYEAEDAIMKAVPLTDVEVESIKDVNTLPKQRRWQLYAYWMRKVAERIRMGMPMLITGYRNACAELSAERQKQDVSILRKSLIIGATTTGAAKNRKLLEKLNCRQIIVEEAAEVLEAHILSALLPTIEHAVFIGDHEQLRPNPAVHQLAREYNLEVSMFERLIKNDFPYSTLQVQHRMLPKLTELIVRPHFYPRLQDSESVKQYSSVKGMQKNLFFWSHGAEEDYLSESVSHRNSYEIIMAIAIVEYILKQGQYNKSEITVICTYSAQTNEMKGKFGQKFGTKEDGITPEVAVETVDGYQGKENKVIILSLVRSHSSVDTVGFLSVKNRICVAWTRAQHGLYVLGNMHYLRDRSPLWNDICISLHSEQVVSMTFPVQCVTHGKKQMLEHPDDFSKNCPLGGCEQECLMDLSCGRHQCKRSCHPMDDHLEFHCDQPCTRRCPSSHQHPCSRKCSEPCGRCSVMVPVTLRCGHTTTSPCHMENEAKCHHPCPLFLSCGHQCARRCERGSGEECNEGNCQEILRRTHSCNNPNHVFEYKCSESKDLIIPPCPYPCIQTLSCEHPCANQCSQECTYECQELVPHEKPCGHTILIPCYDTPDKHNCEQEVTVQVSGCGHQANLPCHANSQREYCPRVCGMKLDCGDDSHPHMCTMKCGECYKAKSHKCTSSCSKLKPCGHKCVNRCGMECADCTQKCLTQCDHQKCGFNTLRNRDPEYTTYDRTCNELCALCTKLCDNSCEHRICTKKCFEVCDVKWCSEPCKKLLRCSHACLGFCGEICPQLCATCSEDLYKRCIECLGLKENEVQKLYRLVQLECGHILPAKYLDNEIRQCRTRNQPPNCPVSGCGTVISKSRRYTKEIRKAVMEREMGKMNTFANRVTLPLTKLREKVQQSNRTLKMKTQMGNRKQKLDRVSELSSLGSRIQIKLEDGELIRSVEGGDKRPLVYWKSVIDTFNALVSINSELLLTGTKFDLRSFSRSHPGLSFLIDRWTKGERRVVMRLEQMLIHLTRVLDESLDIGSPLIGTFMPTVLYELYRMAFLFKIHYLVRRIGESKAGDVGKDQEMMMESIGREFWIADPGQEYKKRYERFLIEVKKNYIDVTPNMQGYVWNDIPFVFPDF